MNRTRWLIVAGVIAALGCALLAVGWWARSKAPPYAELRERGEGRVIRSSGVISGAVVNGHTGKAIANVRVQIDQDQRRRWITTDERGLFRIDGLEAGDYALEADVEGFRSAGADGSGVSVRLGEGAHMRGMEIELYPPSALHGVLEMDGEVGSGEVFLRYVQDASGAEDYDLDPVWVEGDGVFRLEGLAPGDIEITAEASGFNLSASIMVSLEPGVEIDVGVIALERGSAIRGVVEDTSGRGLRRALVEVIDGNGPEGEAPRVFTGGGGAFDLTGIEGSWVVLRFSAPGHEAQRREIKFVQGQAVEVDPVVLEVLEGLVVRVFSHDGREMPGVNVQVIKGNDDEPLYEQVTTGGELVFEELRGGPFLLRAFDDVHGPSGDEVISAGQEVILRMGAPTHLVGELRVFGAQPSSTLITLLRVEEGARPVTIESRETSGNPFDIKSIPAGRYRFEAGAPSFLVSTSETFEIAPGEHKSVTIELERGGMVSGIVVDDETGEPIPGAVVQLDMGRGGEALTALGLRVVTDEQGAFEMEGIPKERQTVKVVARGYVARMVSAVGVQAGREQQLRILLTPLKDGVKGGLELVGIGVTLSQGDGGVVVGEFIEGGSASGGGLVPGDTIVGVDGTSVAAMRINDVVERIRGDEGTSVVLEVRREDGTQQQVTLTRSRVVREWK